ncbi:MAG: HTH domain-containing protein, partial [Bacteroidales bacterium]|nr:HTH domain-containing protein [Bacteroidales bacterium]
KPVNLWFTYPTHQVDEDGLLKDQESEGDKAPWQRAMEKRKPKAVKAKDRKISLENAIDNSNFGEPVTVQTLAEYMGVTEKTVRNRVKEHGGFAIDNNIIVREKNVIITSLNNETEGK